MMIITSILAFLSIVALSFWIVDAWYSVGEWASRIHIGKWNDRKEWQKAVESCAVKWARKSPTVSKTDNKRNVLWDIIHGEYFSHSIQSWQDASLLLALEKDEALKYVQCHNMQSNQNITEVDHALLAYVLKKKGVLPDGYKKRVLSLLEDNIKNCKTIPYRKTMPDVRFVDTLGLVCPFLYDEGYTDLVKKQVEEYDMALYNGVFPSHAYDLTNDVAMGLHDWSRGIGWYVLCLVLCQDMEGFDARVIRLADALLPFQRNDGGFSCTVFNVAERFESSGTALFGLLFLRAYEISSNPLYFNVAKAIERSLMRVTRRSGAVDFSQGDTRAIGFYSSKFSIMPFTQGMTLLLSKKLDNYVE